MELFPVSEASYALDAVQALCVLAPGAGLPAWLARRRVAALNRWWALVLPGSIVLCVGLIALLPGSADGFTYLALVAVPPLAVAACGWAARGARPAFAALGLALCAVAFAASTDALAGDIAATALTALSCVTLARLLVAVAPHLLVRLALVVMAAIDAYLVFGGGIETSANLLNAATPAFELPRLQTAFLDRASLGYGDLFVAAVFGALLAAELRRQSLAAVVCLVAFVAFDVLFNYFDTLPATVPVAVVLIGWEVAARREQGRDGLGIVAAMTDAQSVNPRGIDANLKGAPQMLEYEAIARRIAEDGVRTVLDWGAGWGQISELLADRGLEVTSFDYREEGPVRTEPFERFPQREVQLSSDPIRLPYPDERFDAVLSCGVLEHVAYPAASLVEIRRILKPGGTIYVYKLPNYGSYLEVIARGLGLYYHGKLPHDRLYSRRSAVRLLETSGFEVVEAAMANMLPLTVGDRLTNRFAPALWRANQRLARVPGARALATNVEVIARKPVDAHPAPAASA